VPSGSREERPRGRAEAAAAVSVTAATLAKVLPGWARRDETQALAVRLQDPGERERAARIAQRTQAIRGQREPPIALVRAGRHVRAGRARARARAMQIAPMGSRVAMLLASSSA
jgi:hypothetical protein